MTKLKDCPFCGGEAKIYRIAKQWSVSCSCCEAEITRNTMDCNTTCQVQKRRIDAINIWNSRHDTLIEQNKQLVEALESVINIINEVYMPDYDESISHEHFEEISAVRKAMINPMEILAKHKEQI